MKPYTILRSGVTWPLLAVEPSFPLAMLEATNLIHQGRFLTLD